MAISIGDAVLNITGNDKGLTKVLDGVNRKVKQLGKGMLALGSASTAVTALMIRNFTEAGDTIGKMSKRTGIGVEALSRLKFAADLSGGSIEDMEKSVRKMQQTMLQAERGQQTYIDLLGFLNLTLADLQGLDVETQFLKMLDALSGVEDASRRAAIAAEVFGRSGTRLLPMLTEGTAGLRRMMQEADELGIVFDEKATENAEDFKDAILRLKSALMGIGFVIAGSMVPDLNGMILRLKDSVILVRALVETNKEAIIGILKWGPAVAAMGGFLIILPFLLSGLAALLSPIGLIGIAIAALLAKIAIPKIKEKFAGVLAETKKAKDEQKALQRATNREESAEVRRHNKVLKDIELLDAQARAGARYGAPFKDERTKFFTTDENEWDAHIARLLGKEAQFHSDRLAEIRRGAEQALAAWEEGRKQIVENQKSFGDKILITLRSIADDINNWISDQFGPKVVAVIDQVLLTINQIITDNFTGFSPAEIIDGLINLIEAVAASVGDGLSKAWKRLWPAFLEEIKNSIQDAKEILLDFLDLVNPFGGPAPVATGPITSGGGGGGRSGESRSVTNNISAPITIHSPGVTLNENDIAAAFADRMRFETSGGR